MGHWQLRGYGSWISVDKGSGMLLGRIGPFYPVYWAALKVALDAQASLVGSRLCFGSWSGGESGCPGMTSAGPTDQPPGNRKRAIGEACPAARLPCIRRPWDQGHASPRFWAPHRQLACPAAGGPLSETGGSSADAAVSAAVQAACR